MNKHPNERRAERLMIGQTLLNAITPIGLSYGAKALPQIQFLAYISLIAAVCFFFITAYRKKFHQLKDSKVRFQLMLYTIAIHIIPFGIITYAARYTSAINVTIFTQIEILYAAIFGWFFLKEKLQKPKLAAIFLILLANVIIAYNGSFQLNLADLAIILAPISFVWGNSIVKKLQAQDIDWAPTLFFRTLLGGTMLLIISFAFEGAALPPSNMWFFLFWFAILTFVVEKILWQIGMKEMDLSKVTAIGMTYPVFSFIIAFLWLGEIPSNYQWGGIILTIIAIALLFRTTSRQWEGL